MSAHAIRFDPDGTAVCLWTEALPLAELGTLLVTRASNVEFNHTKQVWEVIFDSKVAFSHPSRAECIAWEVATLNKRIASVK